MGLWCVAVKSLAQVHEQRRWWHLKRATVSKLSFLAMTWCLITLRPTTGPNRPIQAFKTVFSDSRRVHDFAVHGERFDMAIREVMDCAFGSAFGGRAGMPVTGFGETRRRPSRDISVLPPNPSVSGTPKLHPRRGCNWSRRAGAASGPDRVVRPRAESPRGTVALFPACRVVPG